MNCRVRLRWGSQVVSCRVLRRFLWFRLVMYEVEASWAGEPPFHVFRRARWYPKWRVFGDIH